MSMSASVPRRTSPVPAPRPAPAGPPPDPSRLPLPEGMHAPPAAPPVPLQAGRPPIPEAVPEPIEDLHQVVVHESYYEHMEIIPVEVVARIQARVRREIKGFEQAQAKLGKDYPVQGTPVALQAINDAGRRGQGGALVCVDCGTANVRGRTACWNCEGSCHGSQGLGVGHA